MTRELNRPDVRVLDFVGVRHYFLHTHGLPVGNVQSEAELQEAVNGHLPMLERNSRTAFDIERYLKANGFDQKKINRTRA